MPTLEILQWMYYNEIAVNFSFGRFEFFFNRLDEFAIRSCLPKIIILIVPAINFWVVNMLSPLSPPLIIRKLLLVAAAIATIGKKCT
jgi:hypothetical protein